MNRAIALHEDQTWTAPCGDGTIPFLNTFRGMDFVLWQGRGALYAGSVLALVVATQEATNKDSNDLWYSTEMQSAPDATRGQKTHAVRPSIMHWRRGEGPP